MLMAIKNAGIKDAAIKYAKKYLILHRCSVRIFGGKSNTNSYIESRFECVRMPSIGSNAILVTTISIRRRGRPLHS